MNKLRQIWTDVTTPRATDPDEARREHMTRVIASMTAGTLCIFSLPIIAGWAMDAWDAYTLVRLAAITLPALMAWGLAVRGHWRWGGFILPLTFWINALYSTLLIGLQVQILFYILALLLAGFLLGNKGQWFFLILCLLGYVSAAWIHGDRDLEVMVPEVITMAGGLLGIALLQQFATGQMRRALEQAHTYAGELARSNAFLTSLSQVAARVETASAPEEVLTTLGAELSRLGITFFLAQPDPARGDLVARFTSLDPTARARAEQLAGIPFHSFHLAAQAWPLAPVVGQAAQPLFVPDLLTATAAFLPDMPLSQLTQVFGQVAIEPGTPALYLPLKATERMLGVFVVWGRELRAQDSAALSVFANQVAAALENARLMQDLERSLEQLRQTQGQLAHAQKMEAIGRLAGGVAHDFNNLLTIVQLSARLLDQQLHARDPLLEHVRDIQQASERGARLTKQLLSFSRREKVEPQVLSLSRAVSDLGRMLQRIIGEDIEMATHLAPDLWPVKVDPGQIEQTIVNLTINARDAMPDGGQIVISTANVHLDPVPLPLRLEIVPGDYVILCVADTGVGMDEETLAHVFEPFFTTKQRGSGTGLGLPAAYGIVRRHNGTIQVESTIGQGTEVRIYLPRTPERTPTAASPAAPTAIQVPSHHETILLVEDEMAVRRLAQHILEEQGYRVLPAANGAEALEVSREHQEPIDLVLTDLVMPHMNGRELVRRLTAIDPQIRVLYMSGYDDDILAHHDIPQQGVAFLAKPFSLETLTERVRLLLEEGSREGGK